MHIKGDNPYRPPPVPGQVAVARVDRRVFWIRTIFYVHLASIVLEAVIVRNDVLLSGPPALEFMLVFPVVSTFYLCPIAMVFAVIASTRISGAHRLLALGSEVALSMLQSWVWLPMVQ